MIRRLMQNTMQQTFPLYSLAYLYHILDRNQQSYNLILPKRMNHFEQQALDKS